MASVPAITPDDVKNIFQSTLKDESLAFFIEAGTNLSNEIFGSSDYSEDRMKQITLFLIAHLASTMSPRMQSETFEGYRYQVQGKFGEGLKSTAYGQTALMLDTDKVLETLGKQSIKFSAFDINR